MQENFLILSKTENLILKNKQTHHTHIVCLGDLLKRAKKEKKKKTGLILVWILFCIL